MKTGTTCNQSGIYRCNIHSGSRITIQQGDRFPPCNVGGGHATTWILVKAF